MSRIPHSLAAITLSALSALAAWPALADTTISTSISDSVSTAVGSVSGSIKKLSGASSGDDKMAQGEYKLIDVATLPDRPGMARLTLQAVADASPEGAYYLDLPQKAVDAGQLAAGQLITAQARPYGMAFAAAQTRQDFFLVLQDAWYRELATRPVVL
jgi:hypothetical protein